MRQELPVTAYVLVAGVIAFFALLLFNRWTRRREAELERHVLDAVTGAPVRASAPTSAPPIDLSQDADLRRPGPYVWPEAPPPYATRPSSSQEAPPAGYDPRGPALTAPSSMSYRGSGIEPARHPARDHVRSAVCGHCGSHRVLVVDYTWSVHPYSGDASWEFVTRCTECGYFNRYAGDDS